MFTPTGRVWLWIVLSVYNAFRLGQRIVLGQTGVWLWINITALILSLWCISDALRNFRRATQEEEREWMRDLQRRLGQ